MRQVCALLLVMVPLQAMAAPRLERIERLRIQIEADMRSLEALASDGLLSGHSLDRAVARIADKQARFERLYRKKQMAMQNEYEALTRDLEGKMREVDAGLVGR